MSSRKILEQGVEAISESIRPKRKIPERIIADIADFITNFILLIINDRKKYRHLSISQLVNRYLNVTPSLSLAVNKAIGREPDVNNLITQSISHLTTINSTPLRSQEELFLERVIQFLISELLTMSTKSTLQETVCYDNNFNILYNLVVFFQPYLDFFTLYLSKPETVSASMFPDVPTNIPIIGESFDILRPASTIPRPSEPGPSQKQADLGIDLDTEILTQSVERRGYTVVQLKNFLRQLGLSTSGNKPDLTKRLWEYIRNR